MTLRFAAALPLSSARVGTVRHQRQLTRAANDNGVNRNPDLLLRDALKHFATHGLGAARIARHEAERAFFAGDRQSYTHWLGICRTLDRRMAAALSAQVDRTAR